MNLVDIGSSSLGPRSWFFLSIPFSILSFLFFISERARETDDGPGRGGSTRETASGVREK